jgi:L-threonylcarbamoyladenylate synthase
MNIIRVDPENPDIMSISVAVETLQGGGVIVYPTDTVYGIGCMLNENSVKRVFAIKGRDFNSPMSVALASVDEVRHYAILSPQQEERIRDEYNRGTTFILKKKNMPDYVTAGLPTVGIRVPDSEICRQLIRKTGPLITTSANLKGQRAQSEFGLLDKGILKSVDLAVDGGKCKFGKPSMIIDLTSDGKVLRV